MSRTIVNGAYDLINGYLPTQQKVIDCIGAMKTPNIMYCGGFGSGKTKTICEAGLDLGIAYPGVQIGTFRKTRVAVKDTTYQEYINTTVPPEYIKKGGWNKSELSITLRNGSRNRFFGIDNFESKASLQFDAIFVDESTELDEQDHIMLQGRLRGKVLPMPMKIDICNPGAPGSYLHRLYVQNEAKPMAERNHAFKYFSATSFENIHNPQSYFDRLKQWEGTQYYARYVMSQWTAFRGSVYEMFDPAVSVIKPFKIPESWRKVVSIDFGYDHPLVILWAAQHPASKRWYVYRQLYKTHLLVRDAAAICKRIEQTTGEVYYSIWADHDAENRAQFEKDWRATEAAHKEVAPGIQCVQGLMLTHLDGLPRIQIFNDEWNEKEGLWYGNLEEDMVLKEENRPYNLQTEIPGYKWGKDDKPVKVNDDGDDALRYLVYSEEKENQDGGTFGTLKAPTHSRA